MRLWWWRQIRKADIPKSDRDLFERFGESVIGAVLAGGFIPSAPELIPLYKRGAEIQKYAGDWLTEQRDSEEQRENRLETLEWAILIFVVLGVIADAALVAQGFGWR